MAYEVGQVAAAIMGAEVVVCDEQSRQPSAFFDYSGPAGHCDEATFLAEHRREDLLVLNPSFQAPLYSTRTRCRTVSYVQGYKTFWHLDPHLDLYVSASHHIAGHIRHNDGIATEVIHPFLPRPLPEQATEYGAKTALGCINHKGDSPLGQSVGRIMKERSAHYPSLEQQVQGDRRELMAQYRRSRLFFTASVAEGFGLMPLEAMACGCIVVGLDGHGGKDYMRFGENSFCLEFRRFDELPGLFDQVVARLDELESVSREAERTAAQFTFERFRGEWQAVLEPFLNGRAAA